MRQKLPILRVIRQTLDYLGDHGGRLISASPLLILILLAGIVLGTHLNHMAYVEQSKLLELTGWLVSTAAPVLAAVAWLASMHSVGRDAARIFAQQMP
jgi:hypothetical protein